LFIFEIISDQAVGCIEVMINKGIISNPISRRANVYTEIWRDIARVSDRLEERKHLISGIH